MNAYRIKGITKDMTRQEKLAKLDEIMRQAWYDGNCARYKRAQEAYIHYTSSDGVEW